METTLFLCEEDTGVTPESESRYVSYLKGLYFYNVCFNKCDNKIVS